MRAGLAVVLALAASSLAAAPPLANETEAAAEAVRRLMDGPGTATAAAVGEDDPELQRVYYDTVSEATLAEVRFLARARAPLALWSGTRAR